MQYCYNCMSEINTDEKCPHCGFDFASGDYVVQPHQLKPGTKVHDRYVIGTVLGEGGFGITYVGIDEILGIKVAIKEFYMSGFVNRNNTYSPSISYETGEKGELFQKNKEKIYLEARVLAKFSYSDGIVHVRDFFNENETAYIVMDFIEGKNLKEILKEKKTLSVRETANIILPILEALKEVHKANIIHRDISPDNIIVSNSNKSYLIDFGAAREFAEDDVKSLSVILKPGYAPEEQYRTKGIQGPWTDVYSICATMYRCISGKRPEDSLERLSDDTMPELYQIATDCPKNLSDVIMKGLAVKQVNRYQSVEELHKELKKAVYGISDLKLNERTEKVVPKQELIVEKEPTEKQEAAEEPETAENREEYTEVLLTTDSKSTNETKSEKQPAETHNNHSENAYGFRWGDKENLSEEVNNDISSSDHSFSKKNVTFLWLYSIASIFTLVFGLIQYLGYNLEIISEFYEEHVIGFGIATMATFIVSCIFFVIDCVKNKDKPKAKNRIIIMIIMVIFVLAGLGFTISAWAYAFW